MGKELAVKMSTMDQAMELTTVETVAGEEHLHALLEMQKALLPIEEHAKADLQERIKSAHQDVHQQKIGFPRMSLEPLKWRHKNGLPMLVLMSLNSPNVTFSGWYQHDMEHDGINIEYPTMIHNCYQDVLDKAKSYCWRNGARVEYSFTFEGLIPDSARVSIAEAIKSGKFDSMWLLVDAPEEAWGTKRKKPISRREVVKEKIKSIELDPVVIGKAHEAFYVIDRFDLTTVEQYVVDEFSQLALPPGDD